MEKKKPDNPHAKHRERLRNAFIGNGPQSFQEHQLIELLLGYAIPLKDTNPLAHLLLDKFGSVEGVLCASVSELKKVEGVGDYTAVLISLAGELHLRSKQYGKGTKSVRLNTPVEASRYCKNLFMREKYETVYVICLDARRKVLHCGKVAQGTLGTVTIYPRLVAECALLHGASGVIITHNHPSGDACPSEADINSTISILKALEGIGINMYDHIIISGDEAYSMIKNNVISGRQNFENTQIAADRENNEGL